MDYRLALFVIMTCLFMMLTGVFGKLRVFSESTNPTIGKEAVLADIPCPAPVGIFCLPGGCFKDGKMGACVAGFLDCFCKVRHGDKGSKYLQLANGMPMKRLGRQIVENMEEKNDEQYPSTLSKTGQD